MWWQLELTLYYVCASSFHLSLAYLEERSFWLWLPASMNRLSLFSLSLILGKGWISMETMTMSPPGSGNPPLSHQFAGWFPPTGDTEHLRYSNLEMHIHLYLCTGIMLLKRCWRLVCLWLFIFSAADLTMKSILLKCPSQCTCSTYHNMTSAHLCPLLSVHSSQ